MSFPAINPYESPENGFQKPAVRVWRRCAAMGTMVGVCAALAFAGYVLVRTREEAAALPDEMSTCGTGPALLMLGAIFSIPILGLITGVVGAVVGGLYDLMQRI